MHNSLTCNTNFMYFCIWTLCFILCCFFTFISMCKMLPSDKSQKLCSQRFQEALCSLHQSSSKNMVQYFQRACDAYFPQALCQPLTDMAISQFPIGSCTSIIIKVLTCIYCSTYPYNSICRIFIYTGGHRLACQCYHFSGIGAGGLLVQWHVTRLSYRHGLSYTQGRGLQHMRSEVI
uniref:Uncharacterized protein n=1 Tax=Anguilla anguilla TaxID=7936 RepID=A0A0E9X514_ANGAN